MKKDYEITEEQLKALMDSSKPIPMIALQCGGPRTIQERANDAWCALGNTMGFDYRTVRPNGKGDRFFSAEPTDCQGIDLLNGNFSGCDQSGGDCPECGE